jgi:hypothetical protein
MSRRSLAWNEARHSRIRAVRARVAAFVLCAALVFSLTLSTRGNARKHSRNQAQSDHGAYFNSDASAKDVGLPIYPGSRPYKDSGQDKSSAKFGLWGSSFAFKLAAVKLETSEPPEKVAAFYKKALAKYGPVLDCRNASPSADDNKEKESSKLDCGSDKPEPGNMTFKAGTKQRQHIVGIERDAKGSIIQLVYVELPN